MVPCVSRIQIRQTDVVPIGNVDGTVRPGRHRNGREPTVRAVDQWLGVLRGEGRAVRLELAQLQAIAEGVARERLADVPDGGGLPMRHVLEVTERVGVGERPMFGKVFHVVTALHEMQPAPEVAAVRTGENPTFFVELNAPCVAASLGKNLISGVEPSSITPRDLKLFTKESSAGSTGAVGAAELVFVDCALAWTAKSAASKNSVVKYRREVGAMGPAIIGSNLRVHPQLARALIGSTVKIH